MFSHFFKKWGFRKETSIHLDYASATPVSPEVAFAMKPYFSDTWANPSALYRSAVKAREAIDRARTDIGRMLRIRPADVTFTSGGTESNNLALFGMVDFLKAQGRTYADMEIVSTRMEHPSVLGALNVLRERGVVVKFIQVSEDGLVDSVHLKSLLSNRTVLVTLAYANSEIGVVQDIKKITRTVRACATEYNVVIRVHVDASQAPLWLPCEMDMLGVDLMTLDAGKCYGPKGVGVLALRHGVSLVPQLHGGGQERGLRSTTENVPGIVGCAYALVSAQKAWRVRSADAIELRDYMFKILQKEIPDIMVNGSRTERIANNVNISIRGVDTEFAVIALDAKHISASTRSACGSTEQSGSHVVYEISHDTERAQSTLRFTLGLDTKKDEIEYAVKILSTHVQKMRTFKPSVAYEEFDTT